MKARKNAGKEKKSEIVAKIYGKSEERWFLGAKEGRRRENWNRQGGGDEIRQLGGRG